MIFAWPVAWYTATWGRNCPSTNPRDWDYAQGGTMQPAACLVGAVQASRDLHLVGI